MQYTNTVKFKVKRLLDSSLVKSSGIYTLSSFVNAAIPFLLLPILTRLLSKEDFGIVAMYTTVASFMMPFVGINMEGAIARKYYSDNNNFSEYIGNCLIISAVSTIIVFAISLLFRNIISKYSSIPPFWLPFASILCFTQFIGLILSTVYQVQIRPLAYGIFQIAQSLLNFGLSILLVWNYRMHWNGRVLAQIFTAILFALIAIGILLKEKNIIFKVNTSSIKHALKFGGGLIPHALGGLLIILTNRFFLLNLVNVDETGLYSIAAQIGSVVSFFTLSFNSAFVPWLYENLKKNNEQVRVKIVKFTYLYFLLISILGFTFYLICPFLFKIFINPKFDGSLKYLLWIVTGFIFQGMYFAVTNYISYAEKTHVQAAVTLCVGITNIALNYFFIKLWGARGAGVAFSTCFLLLFISTWILSSRVYKMPWLLKDRLI